MSHSGDQIWHKVNKVGDVDNIVSYMDTYLEDEDGNELNIELEFDTAVELTTKFLTDPAIRSELEKAGWIIDEPESEVVTQEIPFSQPSRGRIVDAE